MVLRKTAVEQELPCRRGLIGIQVFAVKLLGGFIYRDEPLASSRLFPTSGPATLIVNGVANPLRTLFDGLGERHLLHFHEEAENVAALPRRKAVVVPLVGADMETRGLLVLKGR